MRFTFLSILLFTSTISKQLIAQDQELHFNDIDTTLIKLVQLDSNATRQEQFKQFAFQLFKKGTPISEKSLELINSNWVGVGLKFDMDSNGFEDRYASVSGLLFPMEMNLFAIHYKNTTSNDFHKRIYFSGVKGMSGFYVKCSSREEYEIIDTAIDSILRSNWTSFPIDNLAYQFAANYEIQDEDYDDVFESSGVSLVYGSGNYFTLMRRSNDFIVCLKGELEKKEGEFILEPNAYFLEHLKQLIVVKIQDASF